MHIEYEKIKISETNLLYEYGIKLIKHIKNGIYRKMVYENTSTMVSVV